MNSGRWRPIPAEGYEDHDEVSDLGRIRRSAPGPSTRKGKVRVLTLTRSGHPMVRLCAPGRTRNCAVALLVAAAFLPPKPSPGAILRHRDGDRSNGAAGNLYWATRTATRAGGRFDLTTAQVAEVLASRGLLSGRAVARRFGVSAAAIYAIWKKGEGAGRVPITAPPPPRPAGRTPDGRTASVPPARPRR